MADLNDTEGSLLGFLHEGPKTGWDLLQEVSAGLQRFWNVTSSHVYRELKVLEDRGLIQAGPPGRRDSRPYAITAAGRKAFAAWIAQDPGQEQIRFPLLVTLWFGKHLDRRTLRRFLTSHRQEHQQRLAMYREVARRLEDDDPYVGAVVQFGIHYEQAVLTWLDGLPFAARR